jgi:nucleoside-diphosphate-sugar epimerase
MDDEVTLPRRSSRAPTTRAVIGVDGALGSVIQNAIGARGLKLRHPEDSLDLTVPDLDSYDVVVNVCGPRVRPNLGWSDYLREHVGTSLAIARSMRAKSHLIHFSSAAVYGAYGRECVIGSFTPEAPTRFPNPSYAWAKLAAELAVRAICHERGVGLTVLRPAMVYGNEVASALNTLFSLARRGVILELTPKSVRQHCVHVNLLTRVIDRLAEIGPRSSVPLPVVDPFVFTNEEITDSLVRKHPRAVRFPAPLSMASAMLRHWPKFPEQDAPGMIASLAFLGLDNEFDWRPLFDVVHLSPAEFARERTLTPYLEANA